MNPSSMGIKAIRQELESMGIGTKSFIEKSEFVNSLLDARRERKARCANCGSVAGEGKEEGGAVSLKSCKSCMLVKYCSITCQRDHWSTHKKTCKLRAAELHDEALFKDPPSKEDCPICFLPMPTKLLSCVSLPNATRRSVPVYDFAFAHDMNADFTDRLIENYYPCCGKSICKGCVYSYCRSKTKNAEKCPFCNSDRTIKTDEDAVKEMMKRLEVNDASAISVLAGWYYCGVQSCQQNQMKAVELYTRAAELGYGTAHSCLGDYFCEGGNMNKAKFHWEAAAMAGHHEARYNLGVMEGKSGNMERALKHWTISALAGDYKAMHCLVKNFKRGLVSRESIDSTLTAYNKSCTEMRSDARDDAIRKVLANN